jgi:hypothetical protein
MQRGSSLPVADRHGHALFFPERIHTAFGQPDSTAHAHAAVEYRDRSCRHVDWYQMDFCRRGLPTDACTEHYHGRLAGGPLRVERRLCGLPNRIR